MSDFFVALWVDENSQKLSVMSRKDIVDGTVRLTSSAKLVGTVVVLKWNRQSHRGKIIAFGKFRHRMTGFYQHYFANCSKFIGSKVEMQARLKMESQNLLGQSHNDLTAPKPTQPDASTEVCNADFLIQNLVCKCFCILIHN